MEKFRKHFLFVIVGLWQWAVLAPAGCVWSFWWGQAFKAYVLEVNPYVGSQSNLQSKPSDNSYFPYF